MTGTKLKELLEAYRDAAAAQRVRQKA